MFFFDHPILQAMAADKNFAQDFARGLADTLGAREAEAIFDNFNKPKPVFGSSNLKSLLSALNLPYVCDEDPAKMLAKFAAIAAKGRRGLVLSDAFGFTSPNSPNLTMPDWWSLVDRWLPTPISQAVLAPLRGFIAALDIAIDSVVPGWCAIGGNPGLLAGKALMNLVTHWTGLEIPQVTQTLDYVCNGLCPVGIPTTSAVVDKFIRGEIDVVEAHSWAAMNGVCEIAFDFDADNASYRQTPETLLELDRRGLLDPAAPLDQRLLEVGVNAQRERDELAELRTKPLSVGEAFEAYHTFTVDANKAQGVYTKDKLASDLTANGVKERNIPLLTELAWTPLNKDEIYECYHRLRPGAVSPDLVYGEADMRRDLSRLGYSPENVLRLAAMQSSVLSARMHRAAYVSGAATERQVRDSLRSDGYETEQQDILIAQFDQAKKIAEYKEAGGQSPAALTQAAARGEVNVDELAQQLTLQGQTPAQLQQARNHVVQLQNQDRRKVGLAIVKDDLSHCKITAQEAINKAVSYGVSNPAALELVNEWMGERCAKQPHATASQVLAWAVQSIITFADAQARLEALGYSPADVRAMMDAANLKAQKAIQAAADKAAQQAAKRTAAGVKAKAQVAKETMATARAAKAAAAALVPPAKKLPTAALGKMFSSNLMDEFEAGNRLVQLGYSEHDALRLLAEFKMAKAKLDAAAAKAAAPKTTTAADTTTAPAAPPQTPPPTTDSPVATS